MNFDLLGSSGIVRLRPKATRQFPDGHWEEVDDDWRIEGADRKLGVRLVNVRSVTPLLLNPDHVHKYTSDPTGTPEAKRGFLTLTVKVAVSANNGTAVEPLSVVEMTGGIPPAIPATSDPWDTISKQYAHRPPYWEHLMTCDYIEDMLNVASHRLKELHSGLVYRRVQSIGDNDVFTKTNDLFAEMMSIADKLDPALKAIVPTWGPPGVSGDATEIRRACQRLRDLVNALVEWEVEVYFLSPSEKYRHLLRTLRGSITGVLEELRRIPDELRVAIRTVLTTPGTYKCDLNLKFDAPPNLKEFKREAKRLQGGLFSWL